jgi:plastocyanin
MSAFRFVLLAGVLALATACGSSNSATPSSPTPTPAVTSNSSGNTVAIPPGAQVLGTAAYVPNPITVPVGTMVTWTNNDSTAHTASSNTGVFNSGTIGPGQSFSFTFQAAGTYPYHCSFHAGMVGSVVVQ